MPDCPDCRYPIDPPPAPPHANVCRRFACSSCAALFAVFPDPLAKRYGRSPLCAPCARSAGPTPDFARAIKLTPEDADAEP